MLRRYCCWTDWRWCYKTVAYFQLI